MGDSELKEKIKEILGEIGADGPVLLESLAPNMVPVPEDRYRELIKKEVELEIIYSVKISDFSYRLSDFVEALMKLRSADGGTEDA